jgi:hypothetical protein
MTLSGLRYFIGVCAFVAIGCAAYAAVRLHPNEPSTSGNGLFSDATTTVALESTSNNSMFSTPEHCGQVSSSSSCIEYHTDRYHVLVYYPSDLTTKSYDEGGAATTIVFQNEQLVQGFQIFIVPYSEAQVTERRFLKDEPSGVRTNVQNVVVDGATGAAFYGKNATLGDTYEVWFIHGGFLYEVTTLRADQDKLNELLATWRFV